MSGGTLLQLVAKGAMDEAYLYSNPTVTFWRCQVQRPTFFALDSQYQELSGLKPGGSTKITIDRHGDLMYWMYLRVKLPAIYGKSTGSANPNTANGRYAKSGDPSNPCGDNPQFKTHCQDQKGDSDSADVDPCDPFGDSADDCMDSLGSEWAHWVSEIGNAMIKSATFLVGGQQIDIVYNYYLHCYEELMGRVGAPIDEMVGKRYHRAQLIHDSAHDRVLFVPLRFYFCNVSGAAFPLIATQFHAVAVSVELEEVKNLLVVSANNVRAHLCSSNDAVDKNNAFNQIGIETTHVYLDRDERSRFAKSNFEQVITSVQTDSGTIPKNVLTLKQPLHLNHPVIELIWFVQREDQMTSGNFFNFSGVYSRDPVKNISLTLNGQRRFGEEKGLHADSNAVFFRLKEPFEKHSKIPRNFIYCYSFALNPEDMCNPSGTLNFSRIDNVKIDVELQKELKDETCHFRIYARHYNVIAFTESMAGMKFAS